MYEHCWLAVMDNGCIAVPNEEDKRFGKGYVAYKWTGADH